MSLIRWDPFDELASLRDSMDKLFEAFVTRRPAREMAIWQPAVEIYETDNEVVVRAELPGIDPKNVDITVTEDTLTIRGEHKVEQENKGRDYLRRELRYGAFLRSLTLPAGVQGDLAKAAYKHGMLEITVPKSVRAKTKAVKVEVGQKEPILAR